MNRVVGGMKRVVDWWVALPFFLSLALFEAVTVSALLLAGWLAMVAA